MPLLVEVFREVLHAGGYPHFSLGHASIEEVAYHFLTEANDKQLVHVDAFFDTVVHTFDCDIVILSPTNTRHLSNVGPQRQVARARALAECTETHLARAAKGDLRWVATCLPTSGAAQDAGMSLSEYEDFVFSAVFADTEDPISHWVAMREHNTSILKHLTGRNSVRIVGDHVDLSLSVKGRTFVSCHGRENMPDGEVFTGPVEESVNGWLESTFPAIFAGTDFGAVHLAFKDGIVIEARAEHHQDKLAGILDTDEGSRRIGEFGIGTNHRIEVFTRNILFDEKMAGTIHLALGAGYPETGSVNRCSIHWDFLCDMRNSSTITFDDEVLYRSGAFAL
jgi:aminopeptidase